MSVRPLPPSIYGPVYPCSPSLHVGGVYVAAQVFTKRSQSGVLGQEGNSGPSSETWVHFSEPPIQGEYIVVNQVLLDGGDSGLTPSNDVQVQPIPSRLPTPEFTTTPHNCSSWLTLDSLFPGAEIEITFHGRSIVQSLVERPSQNFHLDNTVAFTVGDVFEAQQFLDWSDDHYESDVSTSLPVQDLKLSNPLPLPSVTPPAPKACSDTATFSNLVEGADLLITNGYEEWTAIVPDMKLNLGQLEIFFVQGQPLVQGDISIQQSLPRCNLASDKGHGTVLPGSIPTAPILDEQLCTGTDIIHVSGLSPPGELQIQRFVSSHPELTEIRSRPFNSTEDTFPRPTDWAIPNDLIYFEFRQQTACGTSPWSSIFYVETPFTDLPTPSIVPPLYECANFIQVKDATPNCEMYVKNQAGDAMSDHFTVTSKEFFIHTSSPVQALAAGDKKVLYGSLEADDKLSLVQYGCGADRNSSNETVLSVNPLAIPSPEFALTPLYHGDPTIELDGILKGALVSALFDGSQYDTAEGAWIPTVEATSSQVSLPVFPWLLLGRQVVPFQAICGNYSSLKTPVEVVTRPSLQVLPTPTALLKGQTNTFIVNARDPREPPNDPPTPDWNNRNWGEVVFDGSTFNLGATATINVATNDPRASIIGNIASRPWNNPATFTVPLHNAAVTPPPPPPAQLTLRAFGLPATFWVVVPIDPQPPPVEVTIQSITWTVTPSWGGPPQIVTGQAKHMDPSNDSDIVFAGDASFPEAGIPTDPQGRLVTISGSATLSFPNGIPYFPQLKQDKVPLTGSIEMADSGLTCIGWSLQFGLQQGDRDLHWTGCPSAGTYGPLCPSQLGGLCAVYVQGENSDDSLLFKQEL